MSGDKVNPVAVAALPIAVVLALSALLPYFQVGDTFDAYSFEISGWSFFSTVDLLMAIAIPLATMLLLATLLPEVREGRAKVTLGGAQGRSFDFPLIAVPAAAVALLGGLIFFLLMLRILFPPAGLSQAGGLFFGALLALALAGSAVGAIVIEVNPSRSAGGFGPAPAKPAAAGPPPPAAKGRVPSANRPAPAEPPAPPPGPREPSPPVSREPPPPAPGSRRG